MGLSNNCINILVDSLLKVKVVARNFLDVFLDVCHGNHTFAQFKSWPPTLNTVCSSLVDDLIHGQLILF
jgi:hypothetical protein